MSRPESLHYVNSIKVLQDFSPAKMALMLAFTMFWASVYRTDTNHRFPLSRE